MPALTRFRLPPNYPNPFNPETWMSYELPDDANVTAKIYNVAGQLVHDLDLGHKRASYYRDRQKAAYWRVRSVGCQWALLVSPHGWGFHATRPVVILK